MNSIAAGTYSWLRYIFPVVAVPVQPNLPISTLWVYPRSIPKMVTLAQTPWKTGPNNPAEPRFSVPFQICDLTSFGGLREGCGGGSLDSLRGSGALKYNKEVTKIISINWITKPLHYNASLLGIWFSFDRKWTKVDHGFPRILIILIHDFNVYLSVFICYLDCKYDQFNLAFHSC